MKNHQFSKFSIKQKIFLGVPWGIGGARTRAGTAPVGLLRRLRRPQATASGAQVCEGETTRRDFVM